MLKRAKTKIGNQVPVVDTPGGAHPDAGSVARLDGVSAGRVRCAAGAAVVVSISGGLVRHKVRKRQVAASSRLKSGEAAMRFMVIVKATERSEAGVLPTEQELAAMGSYNEELVKAGVMIAGEGLHPSSRGARVKFAPTGNRRTVIDGPFSESKELIAGFWIFQVKSLEECIEWVKRCPNPMQGEEGVIEIRQIFEAEDFGEAFTPELQEQERRIIEQAKQNAAGN
jgi:hypothetical protein